MLEGAGGSGLACATCFGVGVLHTNRGRTRVVHPCLGGEGTRREQDFASLAAELVVVLRPFREAHSAVAAFLRERLGEVIE